MSDRRFAVQVQAFDVDGHMLQVGGVPLDRLAARVGGTPFFAYDRRLLGERVSFLRRHLPDDVHLHYAIKANPMPAVVHYLAPMVDGFDVASAQELSVALNAGMAPERIGFAGPGKTRAELSQAVAAGITVELESAREMRTLCEAGSRLGIRPRAAVRVNPDFELKGSGMRMGGGAQQFGVDAELVPQLFAELAVLDIDFVGFHIFAGSQNLRADVLQSTQEKTIELALSLAQHAPQPVRHLNIGGGFGIPYTARDKPLDLPAVSANLARLLPRIQAAMPEAGVIVELGRFIVGECGVYVSRIIDRKTSRGEVFLVTDGGLHHQLAASGNFGQVIRRNYPVAIGTKMNLPATETANVVGCLCTPLDLLADKLDLPPAEVGDLVVIFQSGAYGLTASPTAFLSHPAPYEALV